VIPAAEVCSVILLLVFAGLRCFIGVDLLHFFSEMFCFLLAGSILFVCLASFECLPTVHVQWAVNVMTCTNVAVSIRYLDTLCTVIASVNQQALQN